MTHITMLDARTQGRELRLWQQASHNLSLSYSLTATIKFDPSSRFEPLEKTDTYDTYPEQGANHTSVDRTE